MCGRFASFRASQDLADEFDVLALSDAAANFEPSWNVAPTDPVRIILERPARAEEQLAGDEDQFADGGEPIRAMHTARWGLVPVWAESLAMGAKLINARAETAATRASFRKPVATSRCLIVADGYYEWHTHGAEKTPYYIHPSGGEAVAFAGLYSWWADPHAPRTDPSILTATILTGAARDGLEEIHEREPVMLARDVIDPWLDPEMTNAGEALELLRVPGPKLTWYPVGKAVGSVRNNSPALITEAPQQDTLL